MTIDTVKNFTEAIETVATVTLPTAEAYAEAEIAEENLENVKQELEERAEDIAPETAEEQNVPVNNMYTKLVLDESMDDFRVSFKDLSDESTEDEYLDYDMFDFVYGLVTDDWPRPKNPLGRRMRKFQHTDSDDYVKTNEPTGMSQVSTDMNGNVVVYANDAAAFNDLREACDYYHLQYSDVKPRVNKDSHWAFNMTVYVPMTSEGYPVMVEDFFAQYGWKLQDVIEDHKVGGGKSANWGATYEKRVDKDRKETTEYINDKAVESIFDKFVVSAATNGDKPLETFLNKMFSELKANNLKFSKAALKKRFMAEFEDDFEDVD